MPAIENNTPYAAKVLGLFDNDARDQRVVVVSATFEAVPGQDLAVADEQLSVDSVDRHRGDPAITSIVYPSQMAYAKSMIDLIVTGHAYPPKGRRVDSMSIGVRVADIKKVLLVSGDRFWRMTPAGRLPSSPRPFERLPVIYERAYGGGASNGKAEAKRPYEPRNPVGIGLPGTSSGDQTITSEVPNIEYPSDRMHNTDARPRPAGFGPIGPGWQPRIGYAGTYDETWLRDRAPLLPPDFDSRFFQVAPGDQQSLAIRAGDVVEVAGMTPEGVWRFTLPRFEVPLWLVSAERIERAVPRVDTIHLEPDRYRFHIVARLAVSVLRNRAPLAQVILGEPRPGWLRARYAGKIFRRDKGAAE
jgi:hypothetical protein